MSGSFEGSTGYQTGMNLSKNFDYDSHIPFNFAKHVFKVGIAILITII